MQNDRTSDQNIENDRVSRNSLEDASRKSAYDELCFKNTAYFVVILLAMLMSTIYLHLKLQDLENKLSQQLNNSKITSLDKNVDTLTKN